MSLISLLAMLHGPRTISCRERIQPKHTSASATDAYCGKVREMESVDQHPIRLIYEMPMSPAPVLVGRQDLRQCALPACLHLRFRFEETTTSDISICFKLFRNKSINDECRVGKAAFVVVGWPKLGCENPRSVVFKNVITRPVVCSFRYCFSSPLCGQFEQYFSKAHFCETEQIFCLHLIDR